MEKDENDMPIGLEPIYVELPLDEFKTYIDEELQYMINNDISTEKKINHLNKIREKINNYPKNPENRKATYSAIIDDKIENIDLLNPVLRGGRRRHHKRTKRHHKRTKRHHKRTKRHHKRTKRHHKRH